MNKVLVKRIVLAHFLGDYRGEQLIKAVAKESGSWKEWIVPESNMTVHESQRLLSRT